MRPIQLKMIAFGPYAGEEIIDFTELKQHHLFLITGPTGSGKTTLFDGISYAIYGETSGNVRTGESLRSHLAAEQLLTQVELTFELKGVTYRINRIPKQDRISKRGDKMTEQKPEATLEIINQKNMNNEPIIYSGVSNVNQEIEKIMGINGEQFRQIMMIPQGDFRKLLDSDSESRERILKQLFDTSLYGAFTQKLVNEAKQLKDQMVLIESNQKVLIQKLDWTDHPLFLGKAPESGFTLEWLSEALNEMSAIEQSEWHQLTDQITQLEVNIENNIRLIQKTEIDNQNIILRDETLKNWNKLRDTLPEWERVARQIKDIEKVITIKPFEEKWQLKCTEITTQKNEQQRIQKLLSEQKPQLEEMKKNYDYYQSSAYMAEENQSQRRLNELEQMLPVVMELENLTKQLEAEAQIRNQLQKQQGDQQQLITLLQNKLKLNTNEKETLINSDTELEKNKADILRIESMNKASEKAFQLLNRFNPLLVEGKSIREKLDLAFENRDSKERIYKFSRNRFFKSQAAIIAKDLGTTDPCPVCGATNHPKKAEFTGDVITEAMLTSDEKAYQLADAQTKTLEIDYEKKQLEIVSEHRQLLEAAGQLVSLTQSEQLIYYKKLINNLNQTDFIVETEQRQLLKEFLDASQTQFKEMLSNVLARKVVLETNLQRLGTLTLEATQIQNELTESLALLEVMKDKTQQQEVHFKQIETRHQTIAEKIPANFQNIQLLNNEIIIQKDKLAVTQMTKQNHLVAYQNLKDQWEHWSTQEKTYGELILNLEIIGDTYKKQWQQALEVLGPEGQMIYESLLDKIPKLEDARLRLQKFQQNLHSLTDEKERLIKLCGQMEIKELQELQARDNLLKLEIAKVRTQSNTVKHRLDSNQQLFKEIQVLDHKIRHEQLRYQVIAQMSRVASGQEGKTRITFERYVLGAFLEDILVAANIRLKKMTLGRYALSKADGADRKNKQAGLELEVFDGYTGRFRHVKTLSGGESFKASLAMALGLSDVVQSYAGGVHLDTMFIDEGFGSLDPESLDSAINCLIELQSTGRLVGIISHVPELKERIEAKLEVNATQAGSSTRFVVA